MDHYIDQLSGGDWDNVEEFSPLGQQSTLHASIPTDEQVAPPVETGLDNPCGSRRTKNFTDEEDKALVEAWLNVGLDPVVGNQQSGQTYWNRIEHYVDSTIGKRSGRSQKSLSHRWGIIQTQVSKFVPCHETILRKNASGTTDGDKVAAALSLYKSTYKKSFPLIHCWVLLRFHPKWNSRLTTKRQKTSSTQSPGTSVPPSVGSSNSQDSLAGEGSELRRPEGCKAAKARKKRASEESSSSVARSTEALAALYEKVVQQMHSDGMKLLVLRGRS